MNYRSFVTICHQQLLQRDTRSNITRANAIHLKVSGVETRADLLTFSKRSSRRTEEVEQNTKRTHSMGSANWKHSIARQTANCDEFSSCLVQQQIQLMHIFSIYRQIQK
jgi:hypothetical protein